MAAGVLLRRGWYRTLETVPAGWCAWHRRHPERTVVDAGTDLLLEGYPSAGNSFAREAIGLVNPGSRIASHMHSSAHIRRALELGVPSVVLLRPPVDSVVSLLARFPSVARESNPERELARYTRFYKAVRHLADRVVLSRFQDTTTRLSAVVAAVNDRFGSMLVPFDDRDLELQQMVELRIDHVSEQVFGKDFERHRALPSQARRNAAAEWRAELDRARYAAARARCEALHDELAATAAATFPDGT